MKQCNATGEITWPNIVVVQEISPKTVKASDAGRKGGQHSGGNFKNDPQRASEAGKKAVNKAVVINQVNPDSPLIINIS